MFYMFEVQIPVDAYPVFGLKRRSFLFVIDKTKTPIRVFLFWCEVSGENSPSEKRKIGSFDKVASIRLDC